MTPQAWKAICGDLADQMRAHVRPFVTPLSRETIMTVALLGSGTYVTRDGSREMLTCEHVVGSNGVDHRFFGRDEVYAYRGGWQETPEPYDAAIAPITDAVWSLHPHKAQVLTVSRFAARHRTSQQAEPLFFMGFAGENSHYSFGEHAVRRSAYCSQEQQNAGNAGFFEIIWEPEHTEFTSGTAPDARAEIKYDDPQGFSGSLVWNTRYLEVTNAGGTWTPEDAVVTGLLQRWDQVGKTLLAWRVEHLNTWLAKHPPA